MSEDLKLEIGADATLLLVDDDEPFLKRLARAMEKRGFAPETAETVAMGKAIAQSRPPAYAVVDLRLEDGNGLDSQHYTLTRNQNTFSLQHPKHRRLHLLPEPLVVDDNCVRRSDLLIG